MPTTHRAHAKAENSDRRSSLPSPELILEQCTDDAPNHGAAERLNVSDILQIQHERIYYTYEAFAVGAARLKGLEENAWDL